MLLVSPGRPDHINKNKSEDNRYITDIAVSLGRLTRKIFIFGTFQGMNNQALLSIASAIKHDQKDNADITEQERALLHRKPQLLKMKKGKDKIW